MVGLDDYIIHGAAQVAHNFRTSWIMYIVRVVCLMESLGFEMIPLILWLWILSLTVSFFFWLGEVARFSTKFSHCLIWMENIDHDNSRIYSTCTQWQYSDLQSNKAWNWFSHCHRNWFIILSIRSAFIAFHESTWNFVYLFSQRQFKVFRRLTADNISSMESV